MGPDLKLGGKSTGRLEFGNGRKPRFGAVGADPRSVLPVFGGSRQEADHGEELSSRHRDAHPLAIRLWLTAIFARRIWNPSTAAISRVSG